MYNLHQLYSDLVCDTLVPLELVSGPVSQVLPVPLLWYLTYRPQHFSINPQNLLSLQKLVMNQLMSLIRVNERPHIQYQTCTRASEDPADQAAAASTHNKYIQQNHSTWGNINPPSPMFGLSHQRCWC